MRREHRQLMLHLEGNCIIHEPEDAENDGLSGRRVHCWRQYSTVVQSAAALRPAALPLAARRLSAASVHLRQGRKWQLTPQISKSLHPNQEWSQLQRRRDLFVFVVVVVVVNCSSHGCEVKSTQSCQKLLQFLKGPPEAGYRRSRSPHSPPFAHL